MGPRTSSRVRAGRSRRAGAACPGSRGAAQTSLTSARSAHGLSHGAVRGLLRRGDPQGRMRGTTSVGRRRPGWRRQGQRRRRRIDSLVAGRDHAGRSASDLEDAGQRAISFEAVCRCPETRAVDNAPETIPSVAAKCALWTSRQKPLDCGAPADTSRPVHNTLFEAHTSTTRLNRQARDQKGTRRARDGGRKVHNSSSAALEAPFSGTKYRRRISRHQYRGNRHASCAGRELCLPVD